MHGSIQYRSETQVMSFELRPSSLLQMSLENSWSNEKSSSEMSNVQEIIQRSEYYKTLLKKNKVNGKLSNKFIFPMLGKIADIRKFLRVFRKCSQKYF